MNEEARGGAFLHLSGGLHLGDDDFLLQDLHGVVGAARLLPHQNDLPKRAFAQKLQIVEVVHCLDAQTQHWVKQFLDLLLVYMLDIKVEQKQWRPPHDGEEHLD